MKRPSTRPRTPNEHNVRERARRLLNHGAQLLQEGQAREAMSMLERAYALLPGDVPTAINLGGACILGKKYKRAIEVLEHAREQEPDNEMIWINLGAAYLGNPILAQDQEQQAAIAAFERALAINPAAPNVHYNLGLIHRDRGETKVARLRFQQAIQANPLDRHARNALQRLQAQPEPSE